MYLASLPMAGSCLGFSCEERYRLTSQTCQNKTDDSRVPGGLPKAELPKYLKVSRWGCCAVVKTSAHVDLPCDAWFWSEYVWVASPHGIDSLPDVDLCVRVPARPLLGQNQ